YSLGEFPTEIRQITEYKSLFRCPSEGFHSDPQNCRIFYRCIGNSGNLTPIQFECAQGTVFDPAISSCNYPYASNRVECGGNGVDGDYGIKLVTNVHKRASWLIAETVKNSTDVLVMVKMVSLNTNSLVGLEPFGIR
ncbi:hornerin-like, partial [Asbolus verrucosus]